MILIVSHVFFFFFFIPFVSSGADKLDVNESLSGDQTLVSSSGNFELGFFRPGESPNYYIGIWYKRLETTAAIVWVANRETPIFDKFSCKLKIIDGNLVLLNESNTQIWSTNTSSISTSSASVVLVDDGNLVLRYGSSSSPPIWQSFEHPTLAFLPGSKLGYNKQTNTKQVITSWRSREDPREGLYSLEIDQNQKSYRSVQYWTSGSWNGQTFSLVPEMGRKYIFNFSFIDNANESFFTYSLYNRSIISRSVLDVSGRVQQLIWMGKQWALFWAQPRSPCEVYALCGAFGICRPDGLPNCNCLTGFEPRSESNWNRSDFSGGCVRKTSLKCGRNTEVLMITGRSLPPNNNSLAVGSAGECGSTCLNNCSCNAYSFVENQCIVWYGDLLNLSEDNNANGKTIYVKVASEDLVRRKRSNGVAVGTVVGPVAGMICILGLILLIIYRKKRLVGKTKIEGSLVAFVYRDLQIATKNFSEKLGGGGFGSVFKGVLRDSDSSVVAVKKLESISQGEKQFRSEVSTIGSIQHVNLVHLRGFCAAGNSKLLVYDYMPNGSLDSHLFHGRQVLNWKRRYEVAVGTARGLVYLHEKCRECIIHCDIKPENILLDSDFNPKISDFGLAKLVGRDLSRVLTTIRGTRGYLAPEWLSGVAVTAKADVYSYGMLLFELVYGKRNAEQCEVSVSRFFPCLVASVIMEGGDILSLLDSRLKREACAEEVKKICKVALWCIQDEEEKRPCMSEVEHILEGVLEVQMPPIPRYVQLYVDSTEPLVLDTESSSNSNGSSQVRSSSFASS